MLSISLTPLRLHIGMSLSTLQVVLDILVCHVVRVI